MDHTTDADENPTPAEYTVSFTGSYDVTVTVIATDTEDAIDQAHEKLPDEVCAQCSGWDRTWSRSVDAGGLEFTEVVRDGEVVETGKTMFDEYADDLRAERAKVAELTEQLAAAKARIEELEDAAGDRRAGVTNSVTGGVHGGALLIQAGHVHGNAS